MRSLACLFLVALTVSVSAQQADLGQRIAVQELQDYQYQKKQTRRLIHFKSKWTYLNPLTYIGGGLMFFYQNVISDQLQASCLYETSCSDYTKQCIQHYGMLRGTLQGLSQLSECQHGSLQEHPPVMIREDLKIRNNIEDLR